MNRKVLSILLLIGDGYIAEAQVGIGTTSPNNSAQLEIVSADKGVLIPQVTLNSSTDSSVITNGNVNSLLVFNTASVSDVFPGYYYWLTDKWMRIISNNDLPANILTWDPAQNRFAYRDPAGNLQPVDLDRLLKSHETQTSIINNGGGNYTYRNEAGSDAVINVTDDVKDNFSSIAADPAVRDIFSDIAKNTSGIVNYNLETREFLYKDNLGADQRADLDSIVKSHETQTNIINNGGGNYTYRNEAGINEFINVIEDVKANASDIFSNPGVSAAVKSTTTNLLQSNGNIISSLVNGVKADTALINTIENRLQQNNLTTEVNGVTSNLLDLSGLKVEPWNMFGGNEKALLNTDQIYTMGSWVGIGTNDTNGLQ